MATVTVTEVDIDLTFGVQVVVSALQPAGFATDGPSNDLVREILLKSLEAVENGNPSIDLNVDASGTIQRDTTFSLPPKGGAVSFSVVMASSRSAESAAKAKESAATAKKSAAASKKSAATAKESAAASKKSAAVSKKSAAASKKSAVTTKKSSHKPKS